MRFAASCLAPFLAVSASAMAEPTPIVSQDFSFDVDRDQSPYRLESAVERPMRMTDPGLALRVSEALQPDGTRKKSQGVIAGMEVADDTVIGFGIFEMTPKKQNMAGPSRFDGPTRRSRKAAIGMTFKF